MDVDSTLVNGLDDTLPLAGGGEEDAGDDDDDHDATYVWVDESGAVKITD